ncbi:MAG TPA: UDP-N-acetylmuramate--L-alanine ligase [Planctomycetota bacterium]|nr:UDP-N-acetylmuramate--L-alanine ligase [Planctomycetota bacterium]
MDSLLRTPPAVLRPDTEKYRGPVLAPGPVVPLFLNRPDSGIDTRRKGHVDFAGRRIHFMGAGGIGVSALMELAAARGAIVSGCDCCEGGQVPHLRARNMQIDAAHSPNHICDCDELVHTAAVNADHAEVARARNENKIVRSRMAMLGQLARGTRAVCVTGAHGKTSTTWMIARILIAANRDPSVLVGGVVPGLNGNVRIGQGDEFVIETDESDNKLHEIVPSIPVLTNIDNDHLENYGSLEKLQNAIARFMSSTDSSDPLAALIGCGDDARVRHILSVASVFCRRPVLSYGFDAHNSLVGLNLRSENGGLSWRFDALGPFGVWQDMLLPMPGRHNVLNALAAIGTAWQLGVAESVIRGALAGIERVGRRFEIKLNGPVRVIDDYGHHPTEIALTLKAARASTRKRLGVLFQPHRYTRTAALMGQFAACFAEADAVFLLPIYAAGETAIDGVTHESLAEALREAGHSHVTTFGKRDDAVAALVKWSRRGDTIVTQGAGDVTRASHELVSRL